MSGLLRYHVNKLGVPTLLLIKYYTTFPGLSRTSETLFQDSVVAQQCQITGKQQSLTLYIQCDSTIHRKTFFTSCKETVQLVHSRNTPYVYLHMVFYT